MHVKWKLNGAWFRAKTGMYMYIPFYYFTTKKH